MSQRAFAVDRFGEWLLKAKQSPDWLWGLLFFAVALPLLLLNLGDLPLRDWDEGLVAQVAKEIYQSSSWRGWIYPTLWGNPYLNKPPLVHGLIAIAYNLGGVNEWTSRLPGASLTALSVPFLYLFSRELFHRRTSAVFATAVYITSLPVVRNGRLAMLDGAILCFLTLMMWCVLRARRDSRFALGIGWAMGLLCLTKGVWLAVLLGAIAVAFLYWDTPRLLTNPYLWAGIGLGLIPVGAWYWAQWREYGETFLGKNLVGQSLSRVWQPVEGNTGPPWFYLLELLKYGLPWLIFLPGGLIFAWENRLMSWAKLALVWSITYFVAISLMQTKLPWYVLPLYPALALVVAAQLTRLWDRGGRFGIRYTFAEYSLNWIRVFALMALLSWAAWGYVTFAWADRSVSLSWIVGAVALTLTIVARLLKRRNPQAFAVLPWGLYVALVLLMASPLWLWELNEAYPVKPVAQLVQQQTPVNQKILTSYPFNRPSLNFYSDRQIEPATPEKLQRNWDRKATPYYLLDAEAIEQLKLPSSIPLGTVEGWTLITRSN